MSILYTVDVECDYPGCLRWEHGVVARRTTRVISDARAAVELRRQWVYRLVKVPPHRNVRRRLDLCPNHAHRSDAEIYQALADEMDNRS